MHTKIIKYWKPLITVSLWGSSFVATKIVLSELNPLSIIILRQILGALLLLGVAISTNRTVSIDRKNFTRIFSLALIAVLHLWIQVTGMKYTSASNTGWIIGFSPIFMAIIGAFSFKEKLNPKRIFGILIAFCGLMILISNGNLGNIDLISNKGDFLILLSALTWGIYSAVNKKITSTYPPLLIILFSFIMMTIILIPFTINEAFFISLIHLSLNSWIAIIYLGVFNSGVAYVFWAQALKEMEAAKVGAFLYLEPFVTVFTAWLVLNENITLIAILGGIIITFGVIIVNKN